MFLTILLSFFIVSSTVSSSFKICQTQYRQRHIHGSIKDLRRSFGQQQLTVSEAYSGPSRTSNMKLSEKNIFSCSLFTHKAPSQIFHFVLNMPLEPLTIFAIGSILMLEWVLDTSLTCLKKDKNCEKAVKQLFLETLQQRLRNNF